MKKILIGLSVATSSVLFASGNVIPYYSFINYDKNTNKDYANVIGLYFSNLKSVYKTEIDLEYMNLKYKTTPDYKQTDLTVIVNYFKGANKKFRIGIHNIFSSNPETIVKYQPATTMRGTSTTTTETKYNNSYDFVIFGGYTYYKYLKFDSSINLYLSKYEHLNVVQISPSYGYNFGNYYSEIGSFYLKGTLNYILLSNSSAAPKDNYLNFDIKLENFKGPWVTSLTASIGKSAYKIANEGFVVYNLGEEYKGVYSVSVGKTLKNNDFVSAKLSYSKFEETSGYEASSTSVMVNYVHKF